MKKIFEKYRLPPEKLRREIDPNYFKFKTTEEIMPLEGIIGQERAVTATEFGLLIKRQGYNIFLSGLTGTGKTRYIQSILKIFAKKEKKPDDLCYLFNFKKPSQPISINLPAGKGLELKKDMEELIEDVQSAIIKVFTSEEYEQEKNNLLKEYQSKRQFLIQELNKFAEKHGFVLKADKNGYISVPIYNGKELNEEDYNLLDEKEKEELEKKSILVQEKALEIIRQIQQIEKEFKEKIKKLKDDMALFAIGYLIQNLKNKYSNNSKLKKYFDDVRDDIIKNLDDFLETESEPKVSLPWLKSKGKDEIVSKYTVNLIVDNSECEGAPIVFEFNPTYLNLIGRIEYENQLGVISTDYTKIKAGALHRANGGYLVLQAKDVLTNPYAWEALKRSLKTQKVVIEDIKEQFGAVAISTLKPEPFDINVKVILLGHPYLYQLLYEKDEDFRKLFKIKSDFDLEMDFNEEHMEKMAAFISSHCKQENLKHFDNTGVAKVIEYSCRLAGNQNKLTTRFNELVEILYEANTYAEIENSNSVTAYHVKKAINEKIYRSNRYEEKINEMIKKERILITTEGEVIGQINGLAIVNTGDYAFGKPNRITANTYIGKSGVVNIERETRMSGSIHDKGLLILIGFLGERFAQTRPLTLSASLCFEQLYGGIEGDSASSTELYALLSSLAEVPIKQGIAVTGSVNQKGEIQPVGGVTEKVEGFFKVCARKGLTGEQGVIIPKQNIPDLVLNDEVVSAVEEGKFHIFAVKNIDQGIEILTGVPAGEKDEKGNYPPGTINFLVNKKLEEFGKIFKG